jgi:hypothetical protein
MKIIEQKRHFFTRLPLGLLAIALFSFAPSIIGHTGAWMSEQLTGQPCIEGSCIWKAIPWLSVITFPASAFVLLIYLLLAVNDAVAVLKEE